MTSKPLLWQKYTCNYTIIHGNGTGHSLSNVGFYCLLSDASYSYIGCFHDVTSDPDLDDSQIAFAADQLTVDECAFQCRESGSPYAGLHRGSVCYCGHNYGKHGYADQICECHLI